jgi:hypothetical protein
MHIQMHIIIMWAINPTAERGAGGLLLRGYGSCINTQFCKQQYCIHLCISAIFQLLFIL